MTIDEKSKKMYDSTRLLNLSKEFCMSDTGNVAGCVTGAAACTVLPNTSNSILLVVAWVALVASLAVLTSFVATRLFKKIG